MNYLEQLVASSERTGSIVCMGMDPVLENMPVEGSPGEQIFTFYEALLNKIVQKNVYPASVKPNYAFYGQYGLEALETLARLIKLYKDAGIPVILDVKRGDIGKTAQAYAKEAFEFFDADAVTLSPYLGYDSIAPFIDNYPDKGYYILTKTSNKSSGELQDIEYSGAPLYLYMARKLIDWYHPGIGSVVGATYPQQLQDVASVFFEAKKEVPFLIPGIGSQGGDLEAVIDVLNQCDEPRIHRINSSSAINFAWKKKDGMSYDDAAVEALKELNDEIGVLMA